MAVEIAVFDKPAGMLRQTGSQHVGQQSRRYGGARHIVETFQALPGQMGIYVMEEVVDVLHRQLEVIQAKLIRQNSSLAKAFGLYLVSDDRHYASDAIAAIDRLSSIMYALDV